jgi:hypothetical protein
MRGLISTLIVIVCLVPTACAQSWNLQNTQLRVSGDASGIRSIQRIGGLESKVREGATSVELSDGTILVSHQPELIWAGATATLRTIQKGRKLDVQYQLKADWGFVAKRIVLTLPPQDKVHIVKVNSLTLDFADPYYLKVQEAGGASALLARRLKRDTVFVVQQNPFLKWSSTETGLTVRYEPDIDWESSYGSFESDRVCIGPVEVTGKRIPQLNVAEWAYFENPVLPQIGSFQIDNGEYDGIRNCVRAFLEFKTEKSRRVHIPWCENDYQIDLAKPGAEAEYRRIISRAAELGVTHLLFTPQNSNVSLRSDSKDAWGWESLLWLGYGPKIREGQFDVATGVLHPSVQRMLDYAKSKQIKLMAYVYPTLAWMQDPEWTKWAKQPLGGYVGVDTGNRGFQDWFVDKLSVFAKRYGLGGFSFDHWWIAYDGATSRYAQWYGCRRILSELRRRCPDIVIDGRQQYQYFGPWTWVGGTYPHPTSNDEQPGSFKANADLHTDRVSADKQRYTSYWYTVRNFTPVELNPGFITHQTQRSGLNGFTTDPFRVKDWDVLGWRYSLLSTIATAPNNLVVNMIPARDLQENSALSKEDKAFFRHWMDWPDLHRDQVKNCRPILGPPMVGKGDGTAMIVKDHGTIFLFNPNYKPVQVEFGLDREIGLESGSTFRIRQIYPTAGLTLSSPRGGLWGWGDRFVYQLPAKAAWVLSIEPVEALPSLSLVGITGQAHLSKGVLSINGVRGQVGSFVAGTAILRKSVPIHKLFVNGHTVAFIRDENGVSFALHFAGAAFAPFSAAIANDHGGGSVTSDLNAAGGSEATGEFVIPSWVDRQLTQRRQSWPVTYSTDDLLATWLGSDRLLLFIHIAEPKDSMVVSAKVDGIDLPLKKAYNSIYPEGADRTFLGFYADLSKLARNVRHRISVSLPTGLKPGQFQGAFFENVEPELTGALQP